MNYVIIILIYGLNIRVLIKLIINNNILINKQTNHKSIQVSSSTGVS